MPDLPARPTRVQSLAPTISVIVIGLNEEARLLKALNAVLANKPQGNNLEVFYVDSGSTDRSVEIAKSVPGVQVLHLQSSKPSAAKARNLGLSRAQGIYVQLIDGDSVMQPGWMQEAVGYLEQHADVACVFGLCIEEYPAQSIYMRVCGLDWHVPAGDHLYCGGNSMWKRSVIAAHHFFDETLRLGEEPELCYRVRHQGYRIVRLDKPMVLHDLAMLTFRQYWKRGENTGRAYIWVALRFWRNTEKMWLRESIRNALEPAFWLVMAFIGAKAAGPLGAIVAVMVWWLLRALKIALSVKHWTHGMGLGMLYGLHCQFIRLPALVGQLKVIFAR